MSTSGTSRQAPLVFSNSDLIREAALAGQGLAYVYENEVVADLKAVWLTQILQKWCPAFPGYYLYHPSRRQTPPTGCAHWSASLQTLINAWADELCWSDFREPLHHVRKLVHQADQQNRLRIRPGAPLLPALQRP